MGKKVKMDIRYFHNEEKGVVVAKIMNLHQVLRGDLLNFVVKNPIVFYGQALEAVYKLGIPNTLTAKAKCSPPDVYDPIIGESLARTRLLLRISRRRWKVMDKIEDILSDVTYSASEFIDNIYEDEDDYYARLTKIEETIG